MTIKSAPESNESSTKLNKAHLSLVRLMTAIGAITCTDEQGSIRYLYVEGIDLTSIIKPALNEANELLKEAQFIRPPFCTNCGGTDVNRLTGECKDCDD